MDAWVVQASTGSRAGPESTDGPAMPVPSAFLTEHPLAQQGGGIPVGLDTVVTVNDGTSKRIR